MQKVFGLQNISDGKTGTLFSMYLHLSDQVYVG